MRKGSDMMGTVMPRFHRQRTRKERRSGYKPTDIFTPYYWLLESALSASSSSGSLLSHPSSAWPWPVLQLQLFLVKSNHHCFPQSQKPSHLLPSEYLFLLKDFNNWTIEHYVQLWSTPDVGLSRHLEGSSRQPGVCLQETKSLLGKTSS